MRLKIIFLNNYFLFDIVSLINEHICVYKPTNCCFHSMFLLIIELLYKIFRRINNNNNKYFQCLQDLSHIVLQPFLGAPTFHNQLYNGPRRFTDLWSGTFRGGMSLIRMRKSVMIIGLLYFSTKYVSDVQLYTRYIYEKYIYIYICYKKSK